MPRVDGKLAVARAFGDWSLKEHLSSDPDVVEEMIDSDKDFFILASDGLWKVKTFSHLSENIFNQSSIKFPSDRR